MHSHTDIKKILKANGYRHTPAREAILLLLEKEISPISAEDLFLNVKDIHPSTNLSTVYRSLELFTDKGIVSKVIFGDGKARYELNRHDHHHHLVCLRCKKAIPIENCPLHSVEEAMAKETDFSITGHNLEIFGYCPRCKEMKNEE